MPIWLSIGAAAASFNSIFNGVLEARRQFGHVNLLQITGVLGTQLLPALYAWLVAPTLAHIIPISVCTRLLVVGISAVFVLSEDRLSKITMPKWSVMGDLFRYGSTLSVTTLVGGFVSNVDQFIIARLLGVAAVPFYAVPLGLVTRLNIIPLAFVRAAFPVMSRKGAGDRSVERDGLRFLLPVMTGMCCAGMFLMEPVLTLWLGKSMSDGAAPIGTVMLAGIWHFGIAYVPMSSLEADNRPGFVAKLNVILAVPYGFGQVLVVSRFGLIAASLLWSIRYALQLAVLTVVSRYSGRDLHAIFVGLLAVLTGCALASSGLYLVPRVVMAFASLAAGAAWLMLEVRRPPSVALHGLTERSVEVRGRDLYPIDAQYTGSTSHCDGRSLGMLRCCREKARCVSLRIPKQGPCCFSLCCSFP